MNYLSENNIKTVTLRFLKTYYKFRPRSGETLLSRDLESEDGIVADGRLVFPTIDGKKFTATFEATSFKTREEVNYKLQTRLLMWDALSVSFLLCAFLYSWGFAYGYITIEQLGVSRYFALLGLVFISIYWSYHTFFQNLHKYRYIYAIEQFKRYHANEQWISIGADVFKSPEDLHFKELRDQCVINGFGLIIVDLDLEPQLLITPSRQELFGSRRSQKDFMEALHSPESGVKVNFKDRMKDRLGKPLQNAYSLLRYRRSNFFQLLLSTISLSILTSIAYLQLRDESTVYVDELKYEQTMNKRKSEIQPETGSYLDDSISLDQYATNKEPYIADEVVNEEEDFPGSGEMSGRQGEILISSGAKDVVTRYDCERFYNIRERVYIIQDNLYSDFKDAGNRVARLTALGIEANAIWLGCFSKSNTDYAVYFDMMFESKKEAYTSAEEYRKLLRKKQLNSSKVMVRTINRLQ